MDKVQASGQAVPMSNVLSGRYFTNMDFTILGAISSFTYFVDRHNVQLQVYRLSVTKS